MNNNRIAFCLFLSVYVFAFGLLLHTVESSPFQLTIINPNLFGGFIVLSLLFGLVCSGFVFLVSTVRDYLVCFLTFILTSSLPGLGFSVSILIKILENSKRLIDQIDWFGIIELKRVWTINDYAIVFKQLTSAAPFDKYKIDYLDFCEKYPPVNNFSVVQFAENLKSYVDAHKYAYFFKGLVASFNLDTFTHFLFSHPYLFSMLAIGGVAALFSSLNLLNLTCWISGLATSTATGFEVASASLTKLSMFFFKQGLLPLISSLKGTVNAHEVAIKKFQESFCYVAESVDTLNSGLLEASQEVQRIVEDPTLPLLSILAFQLLNSLTKATQCLVHFPVDLIPKPNAWWVQVKALTDSLNEIVVHKEVFKKIFLSGSEWLKNHPNWHVVLGLDVPTTTTTTTTPSSAFSVERIASSTVGGVVQTSSTYPAGFQPFSGIGYKLSDVLE